MLMLGVLLKLNGIVDKETVLLALKDTLPERHHHLIPLNKEAIDLGMTLV